MKQQVSLIFLLALTTCVCGSGIESSNSITTSPTATSSALSIETSQGADTSDHPDVSYQNVSISYFEYGDPKNPTVVVTGGWPWDSSAFDVVAKQLASDGFHALRYDQRGSGKSGHPSDESLYSLPDLAGELGALIDARAPGKPITMIGEAWSPFIGSEYACTYPGRIKSIVSIGTPSFDLAVNQLDKALGGVVSNPSTLPAVAEQLAALSYFFLLDIPIIPGFVFATGVPTWIINAITTLIDDPSEFLKKDPSFSNWPTHQKDYLPGSYKYKWIVNNRMLKKPKWNYLPVDNVRVFQMNQDVIETPMLINDLENHTPNLNLTRLNGGHLSWPAGGNYAQIYAAITEYANRAQQ